MKRFVVLGDLLSARFDKWMGKEDTRDPYEPPPTPSDDVPAASLHHVRRAREVEEGTAHASGASVLSASSGAVSSLTSSFEEAASVAASYEPSVEDGIAFADYYNGMQDEQQDGSGYEYGQNTPPPGQDSGVVLPLSYKQYVDGPFTSAQMVKTLDSIDPNMHPLQLQQVFVHPQVRAQRVQLHHV